MTTREKFRGDLGHCCPALRRTSHCRVCFSSGVGRRPHFKEPPRVPLQFRPSDYRDCQSRRIGVSL